MDEGRFLKMIEACKDSMYRLARAILWNDSDCADAMQEAMLKAWHSRRIPREEAAFRPWFSRILINECRNIQRRIHREKRAIVAARERALWDERGNVRLDVFLEKLDDKRRIPVILHYVEGYSYREISEILDIPEKTVKSRMYEARRQLEKIIEEVGL